MHSLEAVCIRSTRSYCIVEAIANLRRANVTAELIRAPSPARPHLARKVAELRPNQPHGCLIIAPGGFDGSYIHPVVPGPYKALLSGSVPEPASVTAASEPNRLNTGET